MRENRLEETKKKENQCARTVHPLEDSVYGARAAATGHGDVEFVVVCWSSHDGGLFADVWFERQERICSGPEVGGSV